MLAIVLLAVSAATPQPIDLDSITVDRARILAARPVLASFLIAKPSYTLLGRTILGAADRDDGAERGAVLRGKRLELRNGERVKVLGVLRVIDHKAAVENGVMCHRGRRFALKRSDPPRRVARSNTRQASGRRGHMPLR